jgi:hypothetical protein
LGCAALSAHFAASATRTIPSPVSSREVRHSRHGCDSVRQQYKPSFLETNLAIRSSPHAAIGA